MRDYWIERISNIVREYFTERTGYIVRECNSESYERHGFLGLNLGLVRMSYVYCEVFFNMW